VITSGRTNGRALGGVADTFAIRSREPDAFCDDALEPFRTAFAHASWRGRLRRLHAAGRLAPDQGRAAELGISAGQLADSGYRPGVNVWRYMECNRGSKPVVCRAPAETGELPEQISLARRSLGRLRKVGSGVDNTSRRNRRYRSARSTTHVDPTRLMKKADTSTQAITLPLKKSTLAVWSIAKQACSMLGGATIAR
jgi:hypothetical protein